MGVTKDAEDEIIISGMSGRFPESENLEELWENLMSKEDMIKVDDRRWPVGVFEVDTFGKLKDISRFDSAFFNFSPSEAEQCAPDVRIMLEVAWEAIVDAGYDPTTLQDTPTGVYIGNCIVEAGEALTNNITTQTATGLLNSMHSSLPNKVSEYFKFTGPSETHDTGCSASLVSLDTAVMAMKRGDITAALIGGCNLNLKPQPTIALHRMNMVSKKRGCKVYDKSADGYSRAECISLVFLQWRSQARRIYGRIVNSVTNNDGFKEEGIIFPDSRSQISLLKEAYSGTCVRQEEVSYVEAHGTGTQAGDTQECLAVDSFFCGNRRKDSPLLIGSIKSNLGHAEPASGVASLCKVLLAYTNKTIPPNILLNEINPKLEAIIQGRLKIVTEPTPLTGNALVSLNAFGFGGSNAHVVLLPNENESESEEVKVFFANGRSEAGVSSLLCLAEQEPNKGLQDILQGLCSVSPDLYPARGFVVLRDRSVLDKAVSLTPDPRTKKQVWLLLGGLGSQWVGMAQDLMIFSPFRRSLEDCQRVLTELGADVDLTRILCSQDSDITTNIISMFLGIAAFVIGLVDMLKLAGLKIGGVIGHSLGDTLCGYTLGVHSTEDIMKSAYARSVLIQNQAELQGVMHSVNCGPKEVDLPDGMVVACYNSHRSITTSTTLECSGAAQEYLNILTDEGYKVRAIMSGGFAFHSPAFRSIESEVTAVMGFIESKTRPDTWLSTSYPANQQPSKIGPSFFAQNLTNPVYFSENLARIPEDSIVVEVSGNSALLGLLGPTYKNIGLVRFNRNAEETFLAGVGALYVAGVLDDPYNILPPPCYPTPRSTPSISSAVARGWNHAKKWWVPTISDFLISSNDAKMNKFVSTYELCSSPAVSPLDLFLEEYSVLGRRIVPLSVGVHLAWQSFARVNDVAQGNLSVQLNNVFMHNKVDLTTIPGPLTVCVGILPKSGHFQITVGDTFFMSGVIETHDQILECVTEFNSNSTYTAEAGELLAFYQLNSASNRLISKFDLDDYSCKICNYGENKVSDNILLVLDCHFQALQLEQEAMSSLVYMAGASSIILDGRGFSEADWISKPYLGACRSDAVCVDNAWFDVLEPVVDEISVVGEIESSWAARRESFSCEEEDGFPALLYANLLDCTVQLGNQHFLVGAIHPAMAGQLHICYATNTGCQDHADQHPHAIGILNKKEILDSSNMTPSLHFYKVGREVYGCSPEWWAAVAVSHCLVRLLEISRTRSVLVLGDGDLLCDTFKGILDQSCGEMRKLFINVTQTSAKQLFNTNTTECAINLSSSKHVIDILALTNRCGRTINFLQSLLPDDCGMSSLLKNISVLHFRPSYIKLSLYWDALRSKLYNWANESPAIVGTVKDRVPLPYVTTSLGTTATMKLVTVQTYSDYLDKIFRDYFQHKPSYRLIILGHYCSRDVTGSRDVTASRDVTISLACDYGNDSRDTDNATDPRGFVYKIHFSPVKIRQCLNEICSNVGLLSNDTFVLQAKSFKNSN